MRRATTPTHTFTLPTDVSVSQVTDLRITYGQSDEIILEKTLSDTGIDTEKNMFAVTLTEDETNLFAPGKALIQLKAKVGDTTLESQIIWFPVKPALNSGRL